MHVLLSHSGVLTKTGKHEETGEIGSNKQQREKTKKKKKKKGIKRKRKRTKEQKGRTYIKYNKANDIGNKMGREYK